MAGQKTPVAPVMDAGAYFAMLNAAKNAAPVVPPAPVVEPSTLPSLSDEQQKLLDVVAAGGNALVDATVGSGKALLDDSRLPTPRGWRLVKDICVGDELYTHKGTITRVVGVYPQGVEDVYEVVLADGRRILCSAEHNWFARQTSRRVKDKFEILTTRQMLEKGVKRTEGKWGVYSFRIPTHAPIEAPAIEHAVHPYVVGAFLGNGCCTEKYLSLSAETIDVPQKVAELAGLEVRRRSEHNFTWDFSTPEGHRIKTREFFDGFTDEICHLSSDKRIPKAYFGGSIEQRRALVQGLMDTDGSISVNGNWFGVSFSSTSRRMVDDLRDVMGSLGWTATVSLDSRGAEKYRSGECFALIVNIPNPEKELLFSVGEKLTRARDAADYPKRRDYSEVSIVSIRKLNQQGSMTCFEVDDWEHLFLADDYVVTHNTTAIQALCEDQPRDRRVLYLTYSKLLKADAQKRVRRARVQNFHGVVYPSLLRAGIRCGVGESIARFNDSFESDAAFRAGFPVYDLLVVDEYQDLNEEYARLLRNIASLNPAMQKVFVGDLEQKVRSDTVLEVQQFAQEFLGAHTQVPFTQSFRVGSELADLLSEGWNKPVVGINADQKVERMGLRQATELLGTLEPSQLLVLGRRNGPMVELLNEAEERWPDKYNKNTVYASIREGDTNASYGDDVAVFTTFDASKGLEREVCLVFDYDEKMWQMRNNFAGADPVVLRNVFLVAASRGKQRVVFVEQTGKPRALAQNEIGSIPVESFIDLPEVERPVYDQPMRAASCFDFTFAENLAKCVSLISRTRLDDGAGKTIEIERQEGMIDLSPAVGHYQEAVHFEAYDPAVEVERETKPIAQRLKTQLTDKNGKPVDAWAASLILTAVDTEQMRYAKQVTQRIDAATEKALVSRLGERLPKDAQVQIPLRLNGEVLAVDVEGSVLGSSQLMFEGVADAFHGGELYELKFVSELSHAMFLQLALYLVMSGVKKGQLWNVRTNERWQVSVPDADAFLDAAARCVTKQNYTLFEKQQ